MHAYDVVVYGGTSAGVAAAVQAARRGKRVVLIEQGSLIGGLTSAGLTASDVANYMVIGGLAREFYERIYRYYESEARWHYESHEAYMERVKKRVWGGGDELSKIRWVFEPHVAESVFKEMLSEAGVSVVYGERLVLRNGVRKAGNRIVSIRMENEAIYQAKVFIDTTYEGDLMAAAGVSYTYGRESNSQYGESLNGIRRCVDKARIDPYVEPGNRTSGVLPYVEAGDPGKDGEGDKRIQAYTFRLTLTDEKKNAVPIEKPQAYNPLLYEKIARKIAASPDPSAFMPAQQILFTPMPNRKTDTNGADFVGASHLWPDGDYQVRQRLWEEHQHYVQGLLWFLGNAPCLPEQARLEMKRWGLAADEYSDNRHWPNNLYVREARRMIGKTVTTEHNLRGKVKVHDPIGMCSYPMDCHTVSCFATEDGTIGTDGELMVGASPYPISYGSIVPAERECENLMVPTALSASHVAFASIRMEPSFMILAQSAGTAAVMAADAGIPVQAVPYPELRQALLEDGQILEFEESGWIARYAGYLVEHGVLDSADLFQERERQVEAVKLAPLFVKAARIFRPGANEKEALRILKEEGIQPSKEAYWSQALSENAMITRAAANQLMKDVARRLANFNRFPLKR